MMDLSAIPRNERGIEVKFYDFPSKVSVWSTVKLADEFNQGFVNLYKGTASETIRDLMLAGF